EQVAAVGAATATTAAGTAAHPGLKRVDVGILDDDVGNLLHPFRHVVVRRALRGLQVDEDRVVVLIGDEPGRDDVGHANRGGEHRGEYGQHRHAMPEHVAEAPLV